ncbi:MAG: peptidase U32 [Desulfuromonas sp.]|nr:MAG: peptidase U32 [Desulfuromonas sp.]
MESGADAVYCGLRDFSARAKAKNFTLYDVERMTQLAHADGRRLYVTLNTLVKEVELPQLAETLSALEALRIDGVILQDLAVWRLAKEHFPGLELHASTQMTVHNIAGVRMLEEMGFTRAVLARELTLEQIATIRAATTLELEHFIHGALCFSFSGQCFFSSWLGGKSGNRGRCAQPCRRRYRHRGKPGYFFSTSDLSAIDLLPELTEAGICSLKIEGRMKSAEYVANVVSAYRMALDAVPKRRAEVVRAAKEKLKRSFGRPPTRGFLGGPSPTDIAIPSQAGATGRFIGTIDQIRAGSIVLRSRDRLHLGDRLRVQPQSDQAGTAFTLRTLQLGRQSVKVAPAGSVVTLPTPLAAKFKKGDAVFKVSSEQAFTLSEAACQRRLQQASPPPTEIDLTLQLEAQELTLTAQGGGAKLSERYRVESFPAESTPLTAETLEKVFAATGNLPLKLQSLSCGELPAVVIPPKRLKEIRRDFYRVVADNLGTAREEERQKRLKSAVASLLLPQGTPSAGEPPITVAVSDLREARLMLEEGIERIQLPLTLNHVQNLHQLPKRVATRPEKVIWELPFILFDKSWDDYRRAVKILYGAGFRHFRLGNLGHFPLFRDLDELHLCGSYRLFCVNSQAVLSWKELGLRNVALYIEDDRENMAAVTSHPTGVATTLVLYTSVPLITSRIPIPALKRGGDVQSDRNDDYRVLQRGGLSILSSATDFSLFDHLDAVRQLGCDEWIIDIAHLGPYTPEGKRVLQALRRREGLPGTSPFNFVMGME